MYKIYIVIVCLLLCHCKAEELSFEELQAFAVEEDNGLIQSVDANGTKITVAYRPTDLWVYQELDDLAAEQLAIDSLRKKYSEYYYFILSVSRNNEEALHTVGNISAYSHLVNTMAFKMPEYVMLTTTRQDTIPVTDFIMNRTYGMGSSSDIVFAFNRTNEEKNAWVQLNLNEFGLGVGIHRFRFLTKDLDEAPKVRFNTIN